MDKKDKQTLVLKYFSLWNKRDLDGLSDVLGPFTKLQDWEGEHQGLAQVLEANRRIFVEFEDASIEVKHIAFSKSKLFAEIGIHGVLEESLNVVDVFEFAEDKIISVTAYRI